MTKLDPRIVRAEARIIEAAERGDTQAMRKAHARLRRVKGRVYGQARPVPAAKAGDRG